MNGRASHVSGGRTPAGWWVVLVGACIASAVVTHLEWGPKPWQVSRTDSRRTCDALRELESGRIMPGMPRLNAHLPDPMGGENYYLYAEEAVGYSVATYYTGSEWLTVYCGGDECRVFAAVRGGRGMVNGERWYFCDFEMLRTYIEANMRRRNNDQP